MRKVPWILAIIISTACNGALAEPDQCLDAIQAVAQRSGFENLSGMSSKNFTLPVTELLKSQGEAQQKILPYRQVFIWAQQYGLDIDEVKSYGQDPKLFRVYYHENRPIAVQSFSTTDRGTQLERIGYLNSKCLFQNFNTISSGKKDTAAPETYSYTSQVCAERHVAKIKELVQKVRISDAYPDHQGNEYGFRCVEQGGKPRLSATPTNNRCYCESTKQFINPMFKGTCHRVRAQLKPTDKTRLREYLKSLGLTGSPISSNALNRVNESCSLYKEHLAPPAGRTKLLLKRLNPASSSNKQME